MRQFREYPLPVDTVYESLYDVPDDVQAILDIYEGIKGCLSVKEVGRVNDLLLEDFADQQCFIAEEVDEDETVIIAVANYRKNLKRNFGYLEGLAVEHESRKQKIGAYMLENIIEETKKSGIREVRLSSVRTAISFYQQNGFNIIDGNEKAIYPVMSRFI